MSDPNLITRMTAANQRHTAGDFNTSPQPAINEGSIANGSEVSDDTESSYILIGHPTSFSPANGFQSRTFCDEDPVDKQLSSGEIHDHTVPQLMDRKQHDNDAVDIKISSLEEMLQHCRKQNAQQAACIRDLRGTVNSLEGEAQRYRKQNAEQAARIRALNRVEDKLTKQRDNLATRLHDALALLMQEAQVGLDNVQGRILTLQADPRSVRFRLQMQRIDAPLQLLIRRMDGHIANSSRDTINAGTPRDELTLFLRDLRNAVPKLQHKLTSLEHQVDVATPVQYHAVFAPLEPEPYNDFDAVVHGEGPPYATTDVSTHADAFPYANQNVMPRVTKIIDNYYDFSRRQRISMMSRKALLQSYLANAMEELGRLQNDFEYEEGRTGGMITRLTFWLPGLEASSIDSTQEVLTHLDKKQHALQKGLQELEEMEDMMEKVPSMLRAFDLHDPEEYPEWMDPLGENGETVNAPGLPAEYALVPYSMLPYVEELKAKLKQKQQDEKEWNSQLAEAFEQARDFDANMFECLDESERDRERFRRGLRKIANTLVVHEQLFLGEAPPATGLLQDIKGALDALGIDADTIFD